MNLSELLLQSALVPKSLYIDPAATTVLISSLSGIVIAVGATALILWRRAKKKVAKVLHVDENAHKEVEDELVVNDVEDAPAEEKPADENN